ncbi:MAG: hypothetical protein QOF00_514 [Pseudonocardiales bacterium]|nr:hypothetical protein [Pseudonocardiales bacterium]
MPEFDAVLEAAERARAAGSGCPSTRRTSSAPPGHRSPCRWSAPPRSSTPWPATPAPGRCSTGCSTPTAGSTPDGSMRPSANRPASHAPRTQWRCRGTECTGNAIERSSPLSTDRGDDHSGRGGRPAGARIHKWSSDRVAGSGFSGACMIDYPQPHRWAGANSRRRLICASRSSSRVGLGHSGCRVVRHGGDMLTLRRCHRLLRRTPATIRRVPPRSPASSAMRAAVVGRSSMRRARR